MRRNDSDGYGCAQPIALVRVYSSGAELHVEEVGASSMVWHADRPSASGSNRIRSWAARHPLFQLARNGEFVERNQGD
jgi:hypothetical protein